MKKTSMSSTYDVQRVRGVLLFSTAVLHLCFFLNTITRKTFYSTHKLHMNILHSTRERFLSCWEKRETRHISRTDCMSDSPCFCQFYCWMSVKHGDAEGKTSVSCEYFDNHIADFLLNGHFICGNKKERPEICGKKPETEYKNKSQSVTCNGAILESWSILEACIFSLKWFCPISMTDCF